MPSPLIELADALAASLDAETFSLSPLVSRTNWPSYAVEDLANPVIAVTPGSVEMTRANRVLFQIDYSLNIFVGRHVETDADADAMFELAEEVGDAVRNHTWDSAGWPAGSGSPVAVTIAIDPDEALRDRNVWRAVITATYRYFR